MPKIRVNLYDLYCKPGEYEFLIDSLNLISFSYSLLDDKSQITYLIGPKVVSLTLKDQRVQTDKGKMGKVLMSTKRNFLKEPKFVSQIVKSLDGKLISSERSSFEEAISINLFVPGDELIFKKRIGFRDNYHYN